MKRLIAPVLLCLLFAGCGTYMTQYRNVSEAKKTYSNILVLGYFQNRIARGLLEREISQFLTDKAVQATPSRNSDIDFGLERQLTDEEIAGIRRELIEKGYDGIIVTTLLDTGEDREEIPPFISTSDMPMQYNSFSSYFGFYPALSWEPGRVVTETYFILESSLYTLDQEPGENLQWLGRFKVSDPEDVEKLTRQYARELGRALLANSIRKP